MKDKLDFVGIVKGVLADRKSGSTTIARRVLGALVQHRPDRSEAEAALKLAVEAGSEMVVLANTARACLALIGGGEEPWRAAERVLRLLDESVERCAEVGSKALSGCARVLTLSNSEQLEKIFARAGLEAIYVLESRPGGEGRILARRLSALGKSVVVVPDLSAHIACSKCDCVVVGCDALYPDGFTNKLGSGLLACLAAHYSKPFYAATTKWKVGFARAASKHGPGRVPTFEHVEKGFVSGYISEVGLLEAGEAHAKLAGLLRGLVGG